MIDVQQLYKSYRSDGTMLKVIEDLTFGVDQGHTVALMGPSGSGKTTILNIIAGLDADYSGTVTVDGNRLGEKSAAELDTYRNATIGFIFQEFNLLTHLNALENVLLTLMFSNKPHHKMREIGIAALDVVGLGRQWNRMPSELSGGQKQRVAIARALINNPRIILADEPTANLDSKTEASVLDMIFDLAKEKDATLVLCTHREDIARRAEDRVILTEEVSVALNDEEGGEV